MVFTLLIDVGLCKIERIRESIFLIAIHCSDIQIPQVHFRLPNALSIKLKLTTVYTSTIKPYSLGWIKNKRLYPCHSSVCFSRSSSLLLTLSVNIMKMQLIFFQQFLFQPQSPILKADATSVLVGPHSTRPIFTHPMLLQYYDSCCLFRQTAEPGWREKRQKKCLL